MSRSITYALLKSLVGPESTHFQLAAICPHCSLVWASPRRSIKVRLTKGLHMAQILQKKLRLVPLQIRNFRSAVSIARSGFGDETAMIVFSYLWYFWRNLRLPDFGLMARRQSMTLMSRRAPIALADMVTTAIHGWDVCWLDLE